MVDGAKARDGVAEGVDVEGVLFPSALAVVQFVVEVRVVDVQLGWADADDGACCGMLVSGFAVVVVC